MEIKICGLKRERDIEYVNILKPDYVGFVFARSQRQVSPSWAKKLIEKLDGDIKKVGVFVDLPLGQVKEIGRLCSLDILQFHGGESPEMLNNLEEEVWKAFKIKDSTSFDQLDQYHVEGYLLDSFVKGQEGGTGKSFDWNLIPSLLEEKFLVLAGGLNIANIDKAISGIKARVVDVSSGVEVGGYKDFKKMKNFIKKIRG